MKTKNDYQKMFRTYERIEGDYQMFYLELIPADRRTCNARFTLTFSWQKHREGGVWYPSYYGFGATNGKQHFEEVEFLYKFYSWLRKNEMGDTTPEMLIEFLQNKGWKRALYVPQVMRFIPVGELSKESQIFLIYRNGQLYGKLLASYRTINRMIKLNYNFGETPVTYEATGEFIYQNYVEGKYR